MKPPSAGRPLEKRSYHHGDLRAALIKAAVEELSQHGIEGLTLRGCARRAGVSHAAPAHHFGDVTGLLTAVAVDAYDKLASTIRREVATATPGSADHLVAAAVGYVRFATANPGLFKLMFRRERLDTASPALHAAGQGAFGEVVAAVAAFHAVPDPMADPKLIRRVIALWTTAHGFADLLLSEQLAPPNRAAAVTAALLPDLVRESFGLTPANRPQDLATIARVAGTRR